MSKEALQLELECYEGMLNELRKANSLFESIYYVDENGDYAFNPGFNESHLVIVENRTKDIEDMITQMVSKVAEYDKKIAEREVKARETRKKAYDSLKKYVDLVGRENIKNKKFLETYNL